MPRLTAKDRNVRNARKVRLARFDRGQCTRCGKPMPEDDLRTACAPCRRYGVISTTYSRYYMGLFK